MTKGTAAEGYPAGVLALGGEAGACELVQTGEGTASGRPAGTYKEVTEKMEYGGRTRDSSLVQQKQLPPPPRGFNVCQHWAWHHWRA